MYKAIVFDFDGVIVDGIPNHDEAYLKTFSGVGLSVEINHLHTKIGMTTKEVITDILRDLDMDGNIENLVKIHHNYLYKLYEQNSVIPEGLSEFIKQCHESGLKIGVASGTTSDILEMILEKFNLRKYISAVIGGESVNKGKPEPEMILKVLKKLDINSEEALAIDDAKSGILAAKKINMFAIAYLRYSKRNISEADINVVSFNEINLSEILNQK